MRNFIFVLLSSALFVSCASVHPGGLGRSAKNSIPAKISAENVENPNNQPFQLIEVTFENNSDQWLRIDTARARLDSAKTQVSVVLGQDLVDWAEAKKSREKLDNYNESIVRATLVGVGAVASYSGNSAVSAAGDAAVLGGVGWLVAKGVSDERSSAVNVVKVPATHLYAPFSVPAKMFQRRWILLNKPANVVVSSLVIDVETVEGVKDTYEINLGN